MTQALLFFGVLEWILYMIEKIKNELRMTQYFDCTHCFLRGSYADESYGISSDIDLLIVSPEFKDISILKRKELVNKAMGNLAINTRFDAICLSEEEYANFINCRRKMFFDERLIRIV